MDHRSQTTYTLTVTHSDPSLVMCASLTATLLRDCGSAVCSSVPGTVTCANTVDYSAYTSGSSISLGTLTPSQRSEERRVGKECSSLAAVEAEKKKTRA